MSESSEIVQYLFDTYKIGENVNESLVNYSTDGAKVVKDVTRWRYGQNAHLESSLKVLELWDEDNPPQLLEIEELERSQQYGVRMRFEIAGVPLDKWEKKQERLGRFFAKGLICLI